MKKECFKCGEVKFLSEFYRHKGMADGHLNKCKECAKRDVKLHREENIDRIRAYDRSRGGRQSYEYVKGYRKSHPKAAIAHGAVAYHLRVGNIARKACEVCGSEKSVAHHDDYDKPLVVRWMCQAHHAQWHRDNGEGKNSS